MKNVIKGITKGITKSLKYMVYAYILLVMSYICISIPYFTYIGVAYSLEDVRTSIQNYPTLEEVATFGVYSSELYK
jgi:hypothetical protein